MLVVNIQCVDMSMISPRILLEMPESSVSLLITMKPTTQENFRSAAILLYYILQKYRLNGS
jgi:hypothetical protein